MKLTALEDEKSSIIKANFVNVLLTYLRAVKFSFDNLSYLALNCTLLIRYHICIERKFDQQFIDSSQKENT